jgi:ubiquinone biosynthesis protein UbiJ
MGDYRMPKGPNGEKRPADAIGLAVMVGRIATGEAVDERETLSSAAAEMGRKGGKARAEAMTPERRAEIAKAAAAKRWGKSEGR